MAQNNFNLSKERIEVLHKFRNKDVTVFVEGDDDVIYWNTFFYMINVNAYIEPTYGKDQLINLSKRVIEENINVILCNDKDYSHILGCEYNNPNIVYTEGYSIENHLYCSNKIDALIKKYTRTTTNFSIQINNHYSNFEKVIFDLLVYDIASEKYSKSIKVLGDNCTIFLKNNSSIELSTFKIEKYIKEISIHFCDNELETVRDIIKEDNIFQIIRGHFLTNFVINLIKHFIKSIKIEKKRRKNIIIGSTKIPTINKDNIFVETVDSCSSCRINCNIKKDIQTKLKTAMNYISV